MNLGHLDFDIVSNFDIRISYFSYRDTLHASRDTNLFFTTVVSALQIRLFMQNKANFRKSQMNVTKVLTMDYDKRTLGEHGKTKPIKANQSQFKANIMPKQTQYEPNQTQPPAGSSAARKKSISCAWPLVRKYTVFAVKSLPKITENNPSVEKTSHKEENKTKTQLIRGV